MKPRCLLFHHSLFTDTLSTWWQTAWGTCLLQGWGNHDAVLAPSCLSHLSTFLLQPLSVEDQQYFTGLASGSLNSDWFLVCAGCWFNSGKPLLTDAAPLTDLSLAQALDTSRLLALIPTRLVPHCLPAVGHTRVLIPTRKRELRSAQLEDMQTNAVWGFWTRSQ